MTFQEFNLDSQVLLGINDINFKEPTPIQTACIPVILEGKDILASAETGTGKTGAFVIPILSRLSPNPGKGIKALIITPTRELAAQIDEQIIALGYHTGVTSVTVYGGGGPDDWRRQEKALYEQEVNIIVATPGRLIDHLKIREFNLKNLQYFVLDEADRMLDMGFLPDVRSIEKRLPSKRQNLLFSATIPKDIEIFAKAVTQNPVRINIASQQAAKGIRQISYKVNSGDKVNLLIYLINRPEFSNGIVFVGTKRGADNLTHTLSRKGVNVVKLHGDRSQREREDALIHFKSGKSNVIVATDVLSRGIDIKDISHIINYDVPNDVDDYIHRIGRTARAEATGEAVTIVTPGREQQKMNAILNKMGKDIEFGELPDEINSNGSDPHQGKGNNHQQHRNNSAKSKPDGKRNYSDRAAGNRRSGDHKNRPAGKRSKNDKGRRETDKQVKQNNGRKPHTGNRNSQKGRHSNMHESWDELSLKERQRKSLRDARATKKALMNRTLEPTPDDQRKNKGLAGLIKKLLGKD